MIRAAAAVLTVVALAGCGSARDARRSDVNHYVESVNEIQRGAVVPWNRARVAYVALGRGTVTADQVRELGSVPQTIRALRRQITAVEPPPDAKRMHTLVLRLLSMNAAFAEEVGVFARYVRAVGPLERRVGTETLRLRRALGREHTSRPEQAALSGYAAALSTLLDRFRSLRPPAALRPWHVEQVTRVAELDAGARTLARGLAHRDRALASRGLTALTRATLASPVTVADRSAILAYNARLTRIHAVAAALDREQRRLTKALG